MSPDTDPHSCPPTRRTRRNPLVLVVVIVVLLAGAGGAYALWGGAGRAGEAMAMAGVRRGPLIISVTESGTIQPKERVVIKSEVEGSSQILFLEKEGVHVEPGQLLVELDASNLTEQRDQQKITVISADAAYIRARENLAVIRSQTESDIAKATLTRDFAQQDLTKYLEGEYPRALQKAQADIRIAEEEVERATDKIEWSRRLAEEGYVTRTELQADELAAQRAQINLDLARTDLALLRQYTHQRSLDQLNSDVKQAADALDRTRRKASADIIQAEAELQAKEAELQRQKDRLEKLNQQIDKCRVTAPRAGMVVYATSMETNRWRRTEPLAEGQQVRERQELIHLPSSSSMKVDISVREASLRKIRPGMPVRVTVDALPGKHFWGRVGSIGVLPDASMSWMNPDLKVYTTEVELTGDTAALRSGMSCQAEIIVEQHRDALSIPVQSVVREGGQPVAYVPTPGGSEPRRIEIGLDNNQFVHVLSGLTEGEQVLLSPPLAAAGRPNETGELRDLPAATPPVPGSPVAGPPIGGEAAPAPATQPAAPPKDPQAMTPDERRQWLQSLPEEQRRALIEQFRAQGGAGRGDRGPRGEGGAPREGGGNREARP